MKYTAMVPENGYFVWNNWSFKNQFSMVTSYYWLIMFVFPVFCSAQLTFHADYLVSFPDISNEALMDFSKNEARFMELMELSGWTYETLSPSDQKIIDNQMQYDGHAWYTGPMGCSWYCAGGPDSIWASSSLASTQTNSYSAENAHDFDLRTAWVGNTQNDTIAFQFDLMGGLSITEIHVYNGYAKSESLWKANSRVKRMAIYVDGQHAFDLELEDTYLGQVFQIPPISSIAEGQKRTLQLVITGTYPGTKYVDVCISEINFNGTGDH
jgi:hypothetical protein